MNWKILTALTLLSCTYALAQEQLDGNTVPPTASIQMPTVYSDQADINSVPQTISIPLPPIYSPAEAQKNAASIALPTGCSGKANTKAFQDGTLEAQNGLTEIYGLSKISGINIPVNACSSYVKADGSSGPSLSTACCKYGFRLSFEQFVQSLGKMPAPPDPSDPASPKLTPMQECVYEFQKAQIIAKRISKPTAGACLSWPWTDHEKYSGCIMAGLEGASDRQAALVASAAVCVDPAVISGAAANQNVTVVGEAAQGGPAKASSASGLATPSSESVNPTQQ